jgi:hypothetical protein
MCISGARAVDDETWRCDVCGFTGTFTEARDTIKAHMNERDHLKAVAKQSGAGPSTSQPTVVAAFANAVVRGTAKYPDNFVPKPADIPAPALRSFLDSKRCLGWFQDTLMIDGLEHNVSPLLLDLDAGKQWYADPHFHRSLLDCEGD